MAENNTSNIGFEKQIWDAACVLRGNIDASEYKSVVLGLIFLKYISDRFEAKYKELVEEGDGFEEDQDEYTAENIFFVPENARWSAIAAAAHTPEIGTVIDDAMRSIEKENKRLKDILPKNFARPELDKRRLGEVVDLFTNIQMIEHGNSKDILGRTYEYCLSKFAEQEGKLAGEFYTPSCVVRTLVEVLQPFSLPPPYSTILPSSMRTIRSARRAMSLLWVIITTVCRNSALVRLISPSTSALVVLSRLPVGSSASTIAGLVIRARAIATRCCCPPERLFGIFFSLSSSPSR